MTYGRGSGRSTEVSSRIDEPLFGMLVGVSSFGASKYDGGPPLYRGGAFEVGVDGLSITQQLMLACGGREEGDEENASVCAK